MAYETIAQTAKGTSTSTFGANDTNGNSIIVVIGSVGSVGNVTGVTDGEGNHYTKAFAVANATLTGEVEVWYASGIIGGTTNVITPAFTSAVDPCIIAREYWGLVNQVVINSNFFDQTASTTGNSPAPSSGATGLLTKPYELVIGAAVAGTSPGFTLGAGFSNLATQAATLVTTIATEDMMVTSNSPVTATFGITSGQWACGVATFYLAPTGTTTSTSFTTSTSISSTSASSTSSSISSTSTSLSTSSTSTSYSISTISTSSTSSSISSTSISSTSSSTSISSTSSSISSTSTSSTSTSSTSSSTSQSSTSTSFSSTSSSISSTSSSVSSTSVSSTSSSSSTSTTLPPPGYDYTYQDENSYTVIQQFGFQSAANWICPPNVTSVFAEAWGAGGGGGGADTSGATACGGGGGGGGYSNGVFAVTPGTLYIVTIGAPGTAGAASGGVGGATGGGTGGDTSFINSATLLAKGGVGGNPGNSGQGTGGAGGGGASGVGTTTTSGGAGEAGTAGGASGSGGSSGAASASGNTSSTNGYIAAPAPLGGGGAASASKAGFPPGGGGSGGDEDGNGGIGAGGMVQLTYTTTQNPQLTNIDLVNPFTNPQYDDVNADDGDYFIETGSQYVIAQYKQQGANNTSNIQITWKGRSTIPPNQSPVLLQIYNYNTPGWETLASQTVIPVDTDFVMQATQSTNLSNYYNAQSQVSVRVYQKVI